MGFTTWQEMSSSGLLTGMIPITTDGLKPWSTRPVRRSPSGLAEPAPMSTDLQSVTSGSFVADHGSRRLAPWSTHRFWNHPDNNSYGVGLGFRCAKTAPQEMEQRIRDTYISALSDMGRERFADAEQAVTRGLALDPKNVELLDLRVLIQKLAKKQ